MSCLFFATIYYTFDIQLHIYTYNIHKWVLFAPFSLSVPSTPFGKSSINESLAIFQNQFVPNGYRRCR